MTKRAGEAGARLTMMPCVWCEFDEVGLASRLSCVGGKSPILTRACGGTSKATVTVNQTVEPG
jgi:hypothetical protein